MSKLINISTTTMFINKLPTIKENAIEEINVKIKFAIRKMVIDEKTMCFKERYQTKSASIIKKIVKAGISLI